MKKFIPLAMVFLCLATACCFVACKNESSDVDLDAVSAKNQMASFTMINEVLSNPDNYTGKTIRVKGTFSQEKVTGGTTERYFVNVYDGCCTYTWISFFWDGQLPDPNAMTMITVEGTLRTVEDGMRFPEIVAESVSY